MLDYLIVGGGIAGICFAEHCFEQGKSFHLFHNDHYQSTNVAGGLINPIVLKRFSIVEDAVEQMNYLVPFYNKIEQRLQAKFLFDVPVLRKLNSVEEQNDWFIAADKPLLNSFLSTQLVNNRYPFIDASFKYGKVLQTGYLDTYNFKQCYLNFLLKQNLLREQTFDYDQLVVANDHVVYNDIVARHIIFAEGFGLQHNPFFNYLPLDGTKGELLLIHAPQLELDSIINASIFILPIGNDLYKIGATYNWEDKSEIPTENGKQELLEKLKNTINCDFEVREHVAGVRPTVKDRRPLVGTHNKFKNIHILNGLGTRGVMLGPTLAKKIFDSIELKTPIESKINIRRCDNKYLSL